MRHRRAAPSWMISLLLHVALIVILGLTLRLTPPQRAAGERTAEVGIVLKHQDGENEFFESPDDAGDDSDAAAATVFTSREDLFSEQPPADPSHVLPSSLAVIGPGALTDGGVPTAIGAANRAPGDRRSLGGKGRTGVFGIEGEGYKFAYVFDRSGSMGGSGRSALSAAKRELIASLKSLEKTHQFQIIFYNERPWRFNPTGQPNRLFFATERNKALAAKFVGSITADGATRHEEALALAIRLQPDVIFFLTDADEPKLSPRQLNKIRRMAAGITINAIEFGMGPQMDADNFLARLARDNGGKHAYVDVMQLSPVRRQ